MILHCDCNSFYASVELLEHPELRNRPVAVGRDDGSRHGVILAKNEAAKKFGVKTAETIWQARRKCPELVLLPPHHEKYRAMSARINRIYGEYTDLVEPFSVDESWLDVTGSLHLFASSGGELADLLRARVRRELGITISVGVSFNKVFAKLGSDYKKPDATTVFTRENYREALWPLPASALLYVGPATEKLLKKYAIRTIGELAGTERKLLSSLLGKAGEMLWAFANGLDVSPVTRSGLQPAVKSIGNSATLPRDLLPGQDLKLTLYILCESVAERLREQNLQCSTVQVGVRYDNLFSFERQKKLDAPLCNSRGLFEAAYGLCCRSPLNRPVRSLGVRACQLSLCENLQASLYGEVRRSQRQDDLEHAVDGVRRRFGHFSIQRGIALTDPALSRLDPKNDHVIHPVSFLK